MSATESLGIMVLGIMLIIVVATAGIIFNELSDSIATQDNISQIAKDNAALAASSWGSSMDWVIACILIGMPLISMGLAYFNDIPPIFFYVFIGFILVVIIVGWALQDALITILTNGGVLGAYITSDMPITTYLMRNFGKYSVLTLLLIAIGTYVKKRGGVGYASPY